MSPIKKQSGFALAEVLLAGIVAASIAVGLATLFAQDQQEQLEKETANWMAAYVNAVAAFVASQGPNDPVGQILPEDARAVPFAQEQVGANWLKPTVCGGAFLPEDSFLSCSVPNDFLARFELPLPRVRFYWSDTPVGPLTPSGNAENEGATASTPKAFIEFGVTRGSSGNPDAPTAASLASEINRRLEVDGYEHAEAFAVDFDIDPVATPAVFQNEVVSANLRAIVDTSIRSTVFARLDGSTGTLRINQDADFALITKNATGNDVAAPTDPEASLNVNDIFLRSSDAWVSEINEIAEEAFNVAARAPSFMATVSPVQNVGGTIQATLVTKPDCPSGLSPEITVTPAGFIGNTPANPKFVVGVRTSAIDIGAEWRLGMDIFHEDSAGFEPVNQPNVALVTVLTKCSDTP